MTQEEEIARLKKQLSELVERFSEMGERRSKTEARESQLLAQVSAVQAENQALQEQLAVAHQRIEELEKQKTPPPAFVKANVKQPKGEQKQQIRASPAVQMDETGWREDGVNGYVWCACTPQLRYYEYQHSRGSEVVKAVLGERFEGVLGSDFYASYKIHEGLHQRCWVHLLRDRHELKEQYPEDADVQQWAKDVKAIYERAVAYAGPDPRLPPAKQEAARRTQQHIFEQELWQVCAPYAHTSSPLHTWCERVERFLPELLVCVAVAGVPAENNLAERSVRPLVIARKISGGTRSSAGSETRMGLFSLFGTWAAQGLNPFLQCLAVLSQKQSLPQM
jgi:hypothetical protein